MKQIAAVAAATIVCGLAAVNPTTASAGTTMCDANSTWDTIASRVNSTQIDSGDYIEFDNRDSSISLRVTRNFTATAVSSAHVTNETGTSISVSAGVAKFNGAAGYTKGTTTAMETSRTDTASTTLDFTVPAGEAYMQYVGHAWSKAFVTEHRCSGTGASAQVTWSGWVQGPRWVKAGIKDCKQTSYC